MLTACKFLQTYCFSLAKHPIDHLLYSLTCGGTQLQHHRFEPAYQIPYIRTSSRIHLFVIGSLHFMPQDHPFIRYFSFGPPSRIYTPIACLTLPVLLILGNSTCARP